MILFFDFSLGCKIRSSLDFYPEICSKFNTSSGFIEVGDYTFTGHNVSIITGTHRYESLLSERMSDSPMFGRDIIIGKGVWIGSNAVILGPCKIGDHAVIAAGSVVLSGTEIPSCTIVGGIPAKTIKTISIS
jgi:acetyltransferase-like isoleucine patch superfamily enzyme